MKYYKIIIVHPINSISTPNYTRLSTFKDRILNIHTVRNGEKRSNRKIVFEARTKNVIYNI